MQTYYQKHQQINAFQFNGDFDQFKTELPQTIYHDLSLKYEMLSQQIYVDPAQIKIAVDEHHEPQYFQNLTIINSKYWPKVNRKIKMHSERRFFAKLYQDEHKAFKYQPTAKVLHYGDYVYLKNNRLKIVGQKAFESHWSEKPIRR